MTEQQVRERIQKIREQADDYEVAHGSEDDLWHDVLYAIANGKCGRPRRVAALALTTRDIDFPRYTA